MFLAGGIVTRPLAYTGTEIPKAAIVNNPISTRIVFPPFREMRTWFAEKRRASVAKDVIVIACSP
jgi:hypothetical protein